MDDIVERVKEANRIEDVIEETGFRLQRKRGKYLRGVEHDSLVVNTRNQTYTWNAQSEVQEDVIGWLLLRNKWDFKTAVEWLAKRANLPEPKWSKEDQETRQAKRNRESIFGIAQRVMQRWLWEDKEALAYARSRGWTDETIQDAGLGFSGRRTAAALEDLRGEFSLNEVDPEHPHAVAIIGYSGDVRMWAKKWEIDIAEQPNWLEWKRVPGITSQTRLVYPHIVNGRIQTFSARNILGAEVNKEGREIKSYNLPTILAGEREPYFNYTYSARIEECAIVEGQADAITLGQWGIPAVALCGTAWQDKEYLLNELRKRHERLYLGLDADEAGEKALRGQNSDWPLAGLMGPMSRVVRWPESVSPEGKTGKDANDWLRWGMRKDGLTDYWGEIIEIGLSIETDNVEMDVDMDVLISRAAAAVRDSKDASISGLQRRLRIGYPRAIKLLDELERQGIVEIVDGQRRVAVVEPVTAAGDKIERVSGGEPHLGEIASLSENDLRDLAQAGHSQTDSQKFPLNNDEEADKREAYIRKLVDRQSQLVRERINLTMTIAEEAATWAGTLKGPEGDAAFKVAFGIIAKMERVDRAKYKGSLITKLGIGIREFSDILKAAGQDNDEHPQEVIETLGGFFNGWLVDYIFDPSKEKAEFVYRDPDGKVGVADFLDIDGKRYVPKQVTKFIQGGGVLFPSALGPLKSTRELVAIVEMFINQHYLLENRHLSKIISYYVLLTWVYDCFNALPYLRAMGEPGAGKSELMRRVGFLCYRMMAASGANSAASFFRATETYRGTVFMDEADLHDGGDMSNDLVKFLNLGAMKGGEIWRLEEVMTENGKAYEVITFQTFCPKLIAMRKDFKDDAVGSRSLTIKLMPREPLELKARGIRLYVDEEFREKARTIRNLLMRWRLAMWQPEIEVTEDHMDLEVSSRLNQVTMPLKALAKDDPSLQEEIVKFLREYNREMVLTRSMTIAARIVEAMWKIYKVDSLREKYLIGSADGEGWSMLIGDVTKVANDIMDDMNAPGEGEEESEDSKKKRKSKELTARGVGSLIRNELQLQVGDRRGRGFPVFWNELKLQALAKRYGIDYEAVWLDLNSASGTDQVRQENQVSQQVKIQFGGV